MSAAGGSAMKLRDLAKAGHLAQPEAHLFQLMLFWSTNLRSPAFVSELRLASHAKVDPKPTFALDRRRRVPTVARSANVRCQATLGVLPPVTRK
jgi:hypothetical protein